MTPRDPFERPAPDPPQNVRVELRDGRTLPCELVYEGWVDGAHRWVAVSPVDASLIAAIRADVLPGKTTIVIGTQ